MRPSTLTVDDLEALLAAPDLFARKFDMTVDARVLDVLDECIDQEIIRTPQVG